MSDEYIKEIKEMKGILHVIDELKKEREGFDRRVDVYGKEVGDMHFGGMPIFGVSDLHGRVKGLLDELRLKLCEIRGE